MARKRSSKNIVDEGQPSKVVTRPMRRLRGKPLRDFVNKLKQGIQGSETDPDHRQSACAKLDFVVEQIGEWAVDLTDTPSLPNRPRFFPQAAKGKSYSNIPIPQEHRHVFNGRKQRTQKWSGAGIAAWCHYVAAVDERVVYFLDPPEAALTAAPPSSSSGGLDDLESLKGRTDSDIQVMVEVLFHCGIPTRMISPKRLKSLRREWKYALGYLLKESRTRIDAIDHNVLVGFRNTCGFLIARGKRSKKTVNDYLSTFRRILGWCEAFCAIRLPAYGVLLRNFTKTEVTSLAKQAGHVAGARTFGHAETVAMPVSALRAWFEAAQGDPFDLAFTLCSLNLAAGAADLSDLSLVDATLTNPVPSVDLERGLFITSRTKTFNARWTVVTDRGEFAIRMMNRTRDALAEWIAHREECFHDLSERRYMRERIERAAKARRLRHAGHKRAEIAAVLGISLSSIDEILKQPANRQEWARRLAENGYGVKDIVALTGYSTGSVSKYVRDITAKRDRKPRGNRYAIVTPDPNRIFFVPSTGRPLVDLQSNNNYVRNIFNRICAKAGIVRAVDIDAGRVPPPVDGTFVLPKRNGHYIFRRTAATVAGMLGGVPEDRLQRFLGHDSPEMTRRYVLSPPLGYKGDRMTHAYSLKLTRTEDPIEAIEEFLDIVLKDL